MSEKPQYPPLRSPMMVDGQLSDPWMRYFQHVVTPYFERLLNLEDMETLDWSNNRQKDHQRRIEDIEKLIHEVWKTDDKGFTKRLEGLENALQFVDGPKDATLLRKLDELEALIFSVLIPHPQNTDTALGAVGAKNPPIDADKTIYRDSTASDALVTSTWLQIKAFLKTYFDTLYGALGSAHTRLHSIIDVLDHSSTATSGQILQANANGLPVDATNTDAAVAATVGAAHTQGSDTALGAVGTKNPPIDADKILYRDSTAADVLVTSTWTQIKAFLKTYFDTLYNLYVHPNHSGDVTSVADGPTSIAVNIPSDEHLIGYWAFDDGSGMVAVDGSGNGNNGTLVNMEAADWVDGVVGKCLSFDGADECVDCGDPSSVLDFGTGELTISYWIYPITKNGDMRHVSLFIVTASARFLVGFNAGGNLQVYTNDGNWHDTGETLSLSVWSYIVWVKSGNTLKLYINGQDTGWSMNHTATLGPFTNLTFSGYSGSGTTGINGKLDEIRIYDTALTASEVKALYLYPAGNKGTRISALQINGPLATYANNAAAIAGGLAVGDLYCNGADPDLVCIVH